MSKISGILMLLVYVCVATTLLNDDFVDAFNVQNIARRSALFAVIGIGVAFVIITGGIDLSIGSLIGLIGCMLPMLLRTYGWPVWASLSAVMLVALGIGLIHGLLVTKLKLQPFVVTLCGLLIYRGIARWITGDATQGFGTDYDDSLRLVSTGTPCSAALVLIVLGASGVIWVLFRLALKLRTILQHGQFGLTLFALALSIIMVVVGSSRYWKGWETIERRGSPAMAAAAGPSETEYKVPQAAAVMPGLMMFRIGWLFVPSVIAFLIIGMVHDWRKFALPCVSLLVAITALWLAMGVADWPNDQFWPNEGWAMRWKMVAVFFTLGAFMGALAWFARTGIRLGGAAANLTMVMSAIFAIMCLVGRCYIVSAEIAHENGDRFEGFLVPAPFFLMVGVTIIAAVFLNLTIFGRYLLALGRNEEAARFSGIKTERMVIMAYMLCSGLAGFGGILFALELNSIQPSGHGGYYELFAIAAAVLGGCSLRGGEGSILGVVIGAAVMRVLYNSILLLGIPDELEYAIIGSVILIGVIVDELVHRIAARQRALHEAAFDESSTGPAAKRN